MTNKAFNAFLGPAEEAARLYWRGTDNAFKGCHPAAKSMFKANTEYAGYMLRQTRASMDLPAKVMACKTPVEAVDQLTRFWMGAFEDLVAANERAMSSFTGAFNQPSAVAEAVIEDWQPAAMTPATPRERDRMDVGASSADPKRPASGDDMRKAA